MKRLNIHAAKPLVLCNRDQPVAEIRSLQGKAVRKPRIGVTKGNFVVPDSFFEPLPDAILTAFSGE